MPKEKSNVSTKMVQLDELLAWFDGEDFELEVAMGKFTEAKKLADEIESELLEMKNTITIVGEQFDRD